ncbi:MAG: hypothetical protein KatS3mg085_031 [Candidatus Dojkabacteria bacterium]|nr:MAG: hypothetical protein KatS3mg085_031 [Candidatus Dojkabacteria bacterium]
MFCATLKTSLKLVYIVLMNILKIIPQVNAQSDAIAQPTFGSIQIGGGQTIAAQVLVNTSASSVEVGDQFSVRIEVRTNDIPINAYNIVVEYDPSVLSILDQDPDVAGTQVKLLDTIFTTSSLPNDNFVDIVNGEIKVNASITEGSGLTVNRNVVEIIFQAQSIGSTTIKIKEGVNGTQLIRPSGQSIQYTTNQRSVDIVEQVVGSGEPINQNPNQQPVNPAPNNQSNEQNGTPTPVTQIPDTSLSDQIGNGTALGGGLVLILLGVLLFLRRRPRDTK